MMDVVIAGIGQIPVGEHWEFSLRSLASKVVRMALHDAGDMHPQAMYIGNLLAPVAQHQANLGALLTGAAGLPGIEAFTVEAAGASGAAAFRLGYQAVASGFVDVVVVVGVEKYTDLLGAEAESALAQMLDSDYEAMVGLTPTAQAGLLMRRYMYQYGVPANALADFALIAHANGVNNPNAMFRKALKRETYEQAEAICDPLNLFDMAPYADGAAAVVLTRRELAPQGLDHPLVKVTGSSLVIDRLALHDRPDPLAFDAARLSVECACRQAGMLPSDADLFELCDSFSIYAALSLEAAGLARRGEGWKLAQSGALSITGKLPILTLGGMKARGNPIGASGVYQLVEAALQLRGQAGAAQLARARRALVQSLGGPASTAVTHVLERL